MIPIYLIWGHSPLDCAKDDNGCTKSYVYTAKDDNVRDKSYVYAAKDDNVRNKSYVLWIQNTDSAAQVQMQLNKIGELTIPPNEKG